MSYMLETNGFRVNQATSGQEAIELFRGILFDIVVVDQEMPVMDGRETIQRLKQIASHIPMIIIGDLMSMRDQIHLADAFLDKKITSSFELLERIKIMSARKRGPRKGTIPDNRRAAEVA